MPSYCVVKGCKSWTLQSNRKARFFSFPKDIVIKTQWIKACGKRYVNSRTARICSLHFTDDDWRLKDKLLNTEMEKRVLDKNAIPTQLLPVPLTTVLDAKPTSNSLAKQKCEPPVIKRCLLCKDGRSMSHFSPSGASLECNAPLRKNNWNLEEPNTDRWHDVQMQFLNHVILTWVNRCRNGNLNIVMPDSMLKSKAKEAGKILGTFILCTTAWLRVFKDKLRKLEPTGSQMVSQSKEIADIIEEEWTRFRCDDYEPKLDIRSYEESLAIPLGDRSNIVETSIESYQEALDCLMMVKSYAFSVRNLNAVVIITELEDILKLECL